MLTMDQIHGIRQLYYEQGLTNISEIARINGLDWKTVAKYIDMTDYSRAPAHPGRSSAQPGRT